MHTTMCNVKRQPSALEWFWDRSGTALIITNGRSCETSIMVATVDGCRSGRLVVHTWFRITINIISPVTVLFRRALAMRAIL